MKKMSYAEAIREAMSIRMREDPNVLLFGADPTGRRDAAPAFDRAIAEVGAATGLKMMGSGEDMEAAP